MKRDLEELKADVKAAKMHSAQSIEFLKKFNMVESTEQQPKRADESSSGSSSLDAASGQESDSGTTEKGDYLIHYIYKMSLEKYETYDRTDMNHK